MKGGILRDDRGVTDGCFTAEGRDVAGSSAVREIKPSKLVYQAVCIDSGMFI